MNRIGIISDKNYPEKVKVREILLKIHESIGKYGTLCSGGNDSGPEYWAMRFAQEYDMDFVQFNPSYTGYRMFSAEPKEYYGKDYHHSHNFHRYKKLVLFADTIIVFKEYSVDLSPAVSYAINEAKKVGKKVAIMY